MEQFWDEPPKVKLNQKEELKTAIIENIAGASDKEKVEKIIGLLVTYQIFFSQDIHAVIFPEWLKSITDVFCYSTNIQEEREEILEIIRGIVGCLIEQHGHLFLGMSEWNYLIAQYKLSRKGGDDVLDISLETEDGVYQTYQTEELVSKEMRGAHNEEILEMVEQLIIVFLHGVVSEKIAVCLYKHIPNIVKDLYDGDYCAALGDMQKNKGTSGIVKRYSRHTLALVNDLQAHNVSLSLHDGITNMREQMLTIIQSQAECIFTTKVGERTLEKMLGKADDKAKDIYISTLLKEIELHLMSELFEEGEDEDET